MYLTILISVFIAVWASACALSAKKSEPTSDYVITAILFVLGLAACVVGLVGVWTI